MATKQPGLGPWYAMLAAFVVIALVGLRHAENDRPRARPVRVYEDHRTIRFGDFTYAPSRSFSRSETVINHEEQHVLQQSWETNTSIEVEQKLENPYRYNPYWVFHDEGR